MMWFGKSRFGFYSILLALSLPLASQAGQALLIAYPDSKITVNFLSLSKMELGHAGILMITDSGVTNYYEFGRYNNKKEGMVRKITLPNVSFESTGAINKVSLLNVLRRLSASSGQRGKILAAYVPSVDYDRMNDFVQGSLKSWPDYHWYSNNCATYATAVLRAGRPPRSPIFNNAMPTPENMVKDFILYGTGEVHYDPHDQTFCFRDPSPWWMGHIKAGCQSISSMTSH